MNSIDIAKTLCDTEKAILKDLVNFIEAKPIPDDITNNLCVIVGPYSFYKSNIIKQIKDKYANFEYIDLKNTDVNDDIWDYTCVIQSNEAKTVLLDNFCYWTDYEYTFDHMEYIYDYINWNDDKTTEGKLILVIPTKTFSNKLTKHVNCTIIDTNDYYYKNNIHNVKNHLKQLLTDYIIATENARTICYGDFKTKSLLSICEFDSDVNHYFKYNTDYNQIEYTTNILYKVLFSELIINNHKELLDQLHNISFQELKDALTILVYFDLIKIKQRKDNNILEHSCYYNTKNFENSIYISENIYSTSIFFYVYEIIPQCKCSPEDIAKELYSICNPIVDLRHLTWTINHKLPNIGGSYIKASEKTEDKLYYYKMSRYMPFHGIIGHESINEIICMNIANYLGLSCARYEIMDAFTTVQKKHTLLVRCTDFKPCNASKISLENYYEICKQDKESPLEFLMRIGYEEFCYKLFIFDYLIFNRDRHGANIEFIYQNEEYRLAPIFDNGLSFICSCITPEEFMAYDKLKTGPVNNYIGSRDTFENLKLVPKAFIDVLEKPDNIFQGLEPYFHHMPQEFWDNIQEMFDRRWELVKSL